MNALMLSWVAAFLPSARLKSFVCNAGSRGYSAFRRTLDPGYPAHTLLLTNIEDHHHDNVNLNHGGGNDFCAVRLFSRIIEREVIPTSPQWTVHSTLLAGYTNIIPITNTTFLPPAFLFRCTSLTSIDFSYLASVTKLSPYFLSGCTGLTTIDFTGLQNVDEISTDFLSGSTGLTALSFRVLDTVNKILSGFLRDCTGLVSVDLGGLERLTEVDGCFMKGCSSLRTLDLHPLRSCTKISCCFLEGCSSLESLDLSPLSNVRELSWKFLSGCCGLKRIDLSPLWRNTVFPKGFLEGCSGLVEIDFGSRISNQISNLPVTFLEGCSSLESIDLHGLGNVQTMPTDSFWGCARLAIVYNPPPHANPPDGWVVSEGVSPPSWHLHS